MPAQISRIELTYNSKFVPTYTVYVSFPELAKHRKITGPTEELVHSQAHEQLRIWGEQWQRQCDVQNRAQTREAKQQLALQRTRDAQEVHKTLEQTLKRVYAVKSAVDWRRLEDRTPFSVPSPSAPQDTGKPAPIPIPPPPSPADPKYQPQFSVTDRLMPSRRDQKIAEVTALLKRDMQAWNSTKEQCLQRQAAQTKAYQEHLARLQAHHQQSVRAWQQQKLAYEEEQLKQNIGIQQRKEAYFNHVPEVIQEYSEMVLAKSNYPDFFPREWVVDYNAETKILLVDYTLPAPSDIPTLQEVSYVATKDDFKEKHLTATQQARIYDNLIYQVTLRTLYELFSADVVHAIAAIVFNGYVDAIDRATGKQTHSCVVSIQAKQEEFSQLNLSEVEPKACFKQLKGIGSSQLHSVTPIAPILQMRRTDGRFVSEYAVAHQLDEGYNLASMDWEDFEHLIRELFEQEFSSNGGEVKVTRASHDGGVDAVVFDPDPIRGGKIVIQAKRYSSTVGVAAVRDLYGTLMNEGANKGILVTTSDYGPDAYEFAAGKPLTLLNGANLLHLLEKHGHKAKIDLQEARRQYMQQKVK